MHGQENAIEFEGEKGKLRHTIGGYVSVIYHSIRNGDVSSAVNLFLYLHDCHETDNAPSLPSTQFYHVLVDVAKDVQAGAASPVARL